MLLMLKLSADVGSVVDGSWLLHKVKWQHGGMFKDILEQCSIHISKHCCNNVTVIVDGYM
jgi:hypothetical protein